MSLAIAIFLAAFTLLGVLGGIAWNLKVKVNAPAFIAQIQKLVMANNIDRAIKLCNAAPNALLTQQVKSLLCRANRPQELHLVFEEARYAVNTLRAQTSHRTWLGYVIGFAGTLSLAAAVFVVGPNYDQSLTGVFLGLYVLLTLVVYGLLGSLRKHTYECDEALVKVRNLLYRRNDVVPASHQPRPESVYSAEELAVWRESLEAFNETYTRRQNSGESVGTPQAEYDKQADNQGVLPPLEGARDLR